jgi:hypothetical protein
MKAFGRETRCRKFKRVMILVQPLDLETTPAVDACCSSPTRFLQGIAF